MLNRCLVLLLALARVFVHAHHPVLRFEGLGAEAYNCPDDNIKKIKSNIDRAVNAAAIAHDVIDPDSDLYLHEGPGRRQRQLGESDSSYNLCARNGCPSNHRWQYCWIIGCRSYYYYRDRGLRGLSDSGDKCETMIQAGYQAINEQADEQFSSQTQHGTNCGLAVSSLVVTCED